MNKELLVILLLVFCSLAYATLDVGSGSNGAVNVVVIEQPLPEGVNYTLVNTNSSNFWDALDDPSDIYLGDLSSSTFTLGNGESIIFDYLTVGLENLYRIELLNGILDAGGDLVLSSVERTLNANNGYVMLDFLTQGIVDFIDNNIVTTGTINASQVLVNGTAVLTSYTDTDTLWSIDNIYLNNISGVLTYNETKLNVTIDERSVTGVGQASHVSFWTNTRTLSHDSDLVWDNTNKRLGIGLSIPAHTLHVEGTVGFKEYIYHLADTDTFIRFEPDSIKFWAGNTQYLQLAGGIISALKIVTGDHGTPAVDEVVNVCYGVGDPPSADTTTIGTLFIKYTA